MANPDPPGVIHVRVAGREYRLVVDVEGRVARSVPPFLGKQWVGKRAGPVRDVLVAAGVDWRWQPGATPFDPIHPPEGSRVWRRWERAGQSAARSDTLSLGSQPDGRWWIYQTGLGAVGFLYPDLPAAAAEVAYRLSSGGWRRVPANFDAKGRPLPEEPLDLGPLPGYDETAPPGPGTG